MALRFDGTNDSGKTVETVTFGVKLITLTFWMIWDVFADDNDEAIELSANYNSNDGAFIVNPNGSGASAGLFYAAIQDSVTTSKYRLEGITRPSALIWHHYGIVLDNTTTTGDIKIYLDGVEQSTTIVTSTKDQSSNFKDDNLNIFSRNAASAFGAGSMAHLAIHNFELNPRQIKQLMFFPGSMPSGLIRYYPLNGDQATEPDFSSNAKGMTISGAVKTSGPPTARNARLARNRMPTTIRGPKSFNVDLSLNMTYSENQAKDDLKQISQAMSLSESLSKDVLKALSQSLSLTESKALDFLKVLVLTQTVTESKSLDILKVISQSLSLSESKSLDFLKSLIMSSTLSDSKSLDLLKVFSDTVTLTDTHYKDILKTFSDSLSLTESQTINLIRLITLWTNLARGIIETHDKLSMKSDLIHTSTSKLDTDLMENDLVLTSSTKLDTDLSRKDSDELLWDFHNEQ